VTSLSFTVPAEFLDALTDTVAERVPKLQARRAIPAPGLHHLERQRVAGHRRSSSARSSSLSTI
jgi:hypothetical protein